MGANASSVKELRARTSAGILDCHKALSESGGDIDKAIDWLKKKGLSKADKKSSRAATEGAVVIKTEGGKSAILEINSETDFAAKNESFKTLCSTLQDHILKSSSANSVEELLKEKLASGVEVEQHLKQSIATIGENIVIKRFAKWETQGTQISSYIHAEGRIGVLLDINCCNELSACCKKDEACCEEVNSYAKDVCMHIAALKPEFLSDAEISPDVVSKQEEILKAVALEQGKKAEFLDKIIAGQLQKWKAEVCLLDQPFVKDPDLTVAKYTEQVGKKSGGSLKICRYLRWELSEGVVKEQKDFAAEVAEQTRKN